MDVDHVYLGAQGIRRLCSSLRAWDWRAREVLGASLGFAEHEVWHDAELGAADPVHRSFDDSAATGEPDAVSASDLTGPGLTTTFLFEPTSSSPTTTAAPCLPLWHA